MTVNMLSFCQHELPSPFSLDFPDNYKMIKFIREWYLLGKRGENYLFTPCALIQRMYCRRFALCWLKLFANR
jgi:hypothetical protein